MPFQQILSHSLSLFSYIYIFTFPPAASPAVTAGLTWHPETCPRACARVATVTPKHRAILKIDWHCLNLPEAVFAFEYYSVESTYSNKTYPDNYQ